MAHAPNFEDRMSDAEALMWRLDKDPALTGTYGNLTILDRAPDFDRVRRRLDRAAQVIPRLHQRVQSSPGNVNPPQWVTDPLFDLDYHVRRIALPKPGTLSQLYDLAALLVLDPLERTRPLWHITVIEGLRGGKAAILQKMHHSMADGEAGVRFLMEFLDFERDAPEPPAVQHDSTETGESSTQTSAGEALSDLVSTGLRLPLGILRQLREVVSDPNGGGASPETVRMLIAQLTDLGKAQSPLWTHRSLERGFDVLSTPLHEAKQAAKTFGGTLNTAFLTAIADAVGAYHREFGAPVDTLRASMAISTRTEASGTNAFTLARLTVPTGEMPLRERFGIIHEQAADARNLSTSAPLERLAPAAAALPTSVITRIARAQSQTVDFATSNLRGSPIPVFIAGSEVLGNYPLGPLAGVAFNLTAMSYGDSLDMGLHYDRRAIDEPARLRALLVQSFRRLGRAR